jgi:hypothetical protein
MAPNITLFFDVDTLSFGGSFRLPYSLHDLLKSLPGGAEALLGWMPDITLGDMGLAFSPRTNSFGLFAEAGIAGSADPSAQAFVSTLQDPKAGNYTVVVGLALMTPVEFSSVPVVGTLMEGIALEDLAIVYAGADLPAGTVVLPPPAKGKEPAFKKGLSLVLTLESGGARQSFALAPSAPKAKTLRASDAAGGPPIQWFDVQKKLGPITLGRIGLATSGDWLGLGFDASLQLTALSVDLVGFTAGFPKDDISAAGLDLRLDGLSVYFSSGSLTILGSLLRQQGLYGVSYNGSMLIQAGSYGIAAIGSFARVDGAVSMFVFGAIQGTFGGPPAFVITGLAAGFGYNRSLNLPAAENVTTFPLVMIATLGKQYLPDPKDVATALAKLDSGGFVPPRLGSYWVAAGIQFSSFQMLSTFAMVSVEFGNDLVIALLGVSALSIPRGIGNRPFAFAEMTLSAVLRPLEGSFEMKAVLTPRSFVLDQNCRLTGGFAFSIWFGDNPHSGDFVVTLGGYHPIFVPEPWYPEVPRLGFDWAISTVLRAQGGTYFALTPSAVMAGGALDLRFEAGALKAWFTAYAHFVMWWSPFYFDVAIGVAIGVSYTIDFGVARKTFSVELSVELNLFGPPIAGTARVKWWVISFTIDINGGGKAKPPVKTLKNWGVFADSYFPPEKKTPQLAESSPRAVVSPLVTSGLIAELTEGDTPLWLVAGASMSIGTDTLIPATELLIAAPLGKTQRRYGGPAAGVYPLGSVSLTSVHTLTLRDANGDPFDISRWDFNPVLGNGPESLWGLKNTGQVPLAANVMPGLFGLRGSPPPPLLTGPPAAPFKWLASSPLVKRDLPLPAIPPIDGSTPPPGRDPLTVIATTIAQPETIAARDEIVAVLNSERVGRDLVGGDLFLLAEEVRFTFQGVPMLGGLGSTGPKAGASRHVADVGSQRARSVSPRIAQAPRGPAPRLAALFRSGGCAGRHAGACSALVSDAFTSRAERMVLDAHQALTALGPGMAAVFDLPVASRLTLESDGARALRIVALDAQDEIVAVESFGIAVRWALPDAVARVVVICDDDAGQASSVGWSPSSRLRLVAPQVLLGDGVVVRAQSPLRVRHRRSSRALGVLSGAAFSQQNRTLGQSVEPGWTRTLVPPGASSLSVSLWREEAGAKAPRETELWLSELTGDGARSAFALRPEHVHTHGDAVTLDYALVSDAYLYRACFVRPAAGYRNDGLQAGLERHDPPVHVTRPLDAVTELCFV